MTNKCYNYKRKGPLIRSRKIRKLAKFLIIRVTINIITTLLVDLNWKSKIRNQHLIELRSNLQESKGIILGTNRTNGTYEIPKLFCDDYGVSYWLMVAHAGVRHEAMSFD
jgi:hypothetical protein